MLTNQTYEQALLRTYGANGDTPPYVIIPQAPSGAQDTMTDGGNTAPRAPGED